MPWLVSRCSSTDSATIGSVKLGQPVPESNFVPASNSSAPHPAQWYTPSSWQSQYLPVNARSVPAWRNTANCSGLSSSAHSWSVFSISRAMSVVLCFLSRTVVRAVDSLRDRRPDVRPTLDLHRRARRQRRHLDRRASRAVLTDLRLVQRVDDGEAAEVGEEDPDLRDVAPTRARVGEHAAQVGEHLLRLGLDAARHERAGRRVDADLTCAHDPVA